MTDKPYLDAGLIGEAGPPPDELRVLSDELSSLRDHGTPGDVLAFAMGVLEAAAAITCILVGRDVIDVASLEGDIRRHERVCREAGNAPRELALRLFRSRLKVMETTKAVVNAHLVKPENGVLQ